MRKGWAARGILRKLCDKQDILLTFVQSLCSHSTGRLKGPSTGVDAVTPRWGANIPVRLIKSAGPALPVFLNYNTKSVARMCCGKRALIMIVGTSLLSDGATWCALNSRHLEA